MTPGDPSAKNWPPVPTKKDLKTEKRRVAKEFHPDTGMHLSSDEQLEREKQFKKEMAEIEDTEKWLGDETEEGASGETSVTGSEKQAQLEDLTTYPVPAVYKGGKVPAIPSSEQVPAVVEGIHLPVAARGSAVGEARSASGTENEEGAPPPGDMELVGVVGRKLESEQREAVLRRLNHVPEQAVVAPSEEAPSPEVEAGEIGILEAPPTENGEGQPAAAIESGVTSSAENRPASAAAPAASSEHAHDDHHGHGPKNPFVSGLLRGWAIGMGVGLVLINGFAKFLMSVGKFALGLVGIKGGGKTESHDDAHDDHAHAGGH